MRLLKQFVAGHPFKNDHLAFDGWGLWWSTTKDWRLCGLRSEHIGAYLMEGAYTDWPAYWAAAWGDLSIVKNRDALKHRDDWEKWLYLSRESVKNNQGMLDAREYFIRYYTKLGMTVVDSFPKDLIEHVAVELDQAMERGDPVNGDLLAYIHKALK